MKFHFENKMAKRPVHSSVWCNFLSPDFLRKLRGFSKSFAYVCSVAKGNIHRLISQLAIHIYFFINFVFASFAFLILLKNGQVFYVHKIGSKRSNAEIIFPHFYQTQKDAAIWLRVNEFANPQLPFYDEISLPFIDASLPPTPKVRRALTY